MLRRWADDLSESELKKYLPEIDESWYLEMLSCFEVTSLRPDCRTDACRAGAVLFYKIIKNHYRIDGNKRSALVCIYLFFVANQLDLATPWEKAYESAREVAMSTEPAEKIIESIAAGFLSACKPVEHP